ncbi:hypothetical protein P7C73_g5617, partial [Tremellales sp. Uapishka_1]
MSLLAPRPQETERASVLLPTITCSSCAAPIPLSSLGEHVCRPPSRNAPRPTQIASNRTASGNSSSQSRPPPSQAQSSHPHPHPDRARPNRPTISRGPPSSLQIPSSRAAQSSLSPQEPSPAFFSGSPQPRTPSPTNPFFPHGSQQPSSSQSQPPPTIVHGLGLGIGQRVPSPLPLNSPSFASHPNHYPSDVPNSAISESTPMPDTTSGGGAGMAGVGRRAFAAAAWGVTAGISLSHASQNTRTEMPIPRVGPLLPKVSLASRQRSISNDRPTASQSAIGKPVDSNPRGPSPPQGRSLPRSPPQARSVPPSPPKVRSPPRQRSTTAPTSPPERSASSLSSRSNVNSTRRKNSFSSSVSEEDGVSQLLRARVGEPQALNTKLPFFERYKQMVKSSSTDSPILGIGTPSTDHKPLVASPEQATFNLDNNNDDDDLKGSDLPWATPLLAASPEIKATATATRVHHRYPTGGSVSSSSSSRSSASNGRVGPNGSGAETEEVVTPSQSWEGLTERAATNGLGRNGLGFEAEDPLEQIGEEDEDDDDGERLIFGGSTPVAKEKTLPTSISSSTIRPALTTAGDRLSPTRSRTAPEIRRGSSSAGSSSHSGEVRRKVCQKCGEGVGGSKRFVERDGVVLCERDWKKLYLPSCRRCNLPIEKSAVSSSDGQLKGKWHKACFTCTKCDNPFEGDSFYVHSGKPWCQLHYHEQNGTLCSSSSCRQPIEGPCILTPAPNAQRFHPGHLRCDHRGGVSGSSNCRESMEEYYEVEGRRYCERHMAEATKGSGGGGGISRAEKRRTRLVELPVGGF